MELKTTITNDNALNGKSIRIAMLHFAPYYDNVLHNVELLKTLFLQAVRLQPDIIMTPELAVSGYEFYPVLGRDWIKADSQKIIEKFSELARENKVALILGSPVYEEKSDKYYNATIFIDEQGQIIGEHHKILALHGSESWSDPGAEIKPVEWRGYKIGLLICADAYSERITAEFVKQGVDVLMSSAAWGPGYHSPSGEWELMSKETGVCLFVCNRTGNEKTLNFEGSTSTIVVNGRRGAEYADKQSAILSIDVKPDNWLPHSEQFNTLKFDQNGTG